MTTTSTEPVPARAEPSAARLVLEPPPRLGTHDAANSVLMSVLPMLGSLGSLALVATMGRSGGGRGLVAAGMLLLTTLGFVVVQLDRQHRMRRQEVTGARTTYLRYLSGVRSTVRAAADQQRHELERRHPAPAALPTLAQQGARLGSRPRTDPGFLQVRYGVCALPLSLELVPPEPVPPEEADPVAAAALDRLLAAHRLQPDLPATLDLRAVTDVEVGGPAAPARSLARSLICSAAAFHAPEHLAVAVLASPAHLAHWDWVKWLPHAQSPRRRDATGPVRMAATALDDLATLVPLDPDAPHLLLVVDGDGLLPDERDVLLARQSGVTLVRLGGSHLVRLRFTDRTGHVEEPPASAVADQCSPATAEALARRLAPRRTPPATRTLGADPEAPDLLALLGVDDVRALDPRATWRPRPARDRLRVPLGVDQDGSPVHLDLKESAQQGMGPHGLVIGATGSGKSELLRTLVLGLALTHPPEELNMVLVDFKGGATFAGMAPLPHVAAVITNLAQELTLVDRMQDALAGELVRRQELLREAGNLTSVRDYEAVRAERPELAPLPSLLIVVDEFSEMLSAKPEFLDLFVAIGRLGRSLGLHLLLASQRLEEGRLRGLESHLSYRIGLRTFSAAESRAVLGVPDAYELPAEPGLGYLKSDPVTTVRFTGAYVSGPLAPPRRSRLETEGEPCGIWPFTLTEVLALGAPTTDGDRQPTPVSPPDPPTLLDTAVRRLTGRGPAAHRVWLPPLGLPDSLDSLMPDLVVSPDVGLHSPTWRRRGGLVLPVGVVDRPRAQRRDVLTVDLRGAGGHAVVVGGTHSGKSTLLRTIVASLALTTTPWESQVFVLDFGGGTFTPFADLPHVAGLATRSEPEVVRRILAEVRGAVDRREAYFRSHGIDTIETYRARRAAGRADDGYGEIFLVVDGWGTLRADFDEVEAELQQLAGRGLAFGLHLLVGAARWADLRAAMRDLFGTRLELRLGDPLDSEIDRRTAAAVPADRPGRGLTPEGLHLLAAVPRIDGSAEAATLGRGAEDLVARSRTSWAGPPGPKLRLLPGLVPLEEVRGLGDGPQGPIPAGALLLGVDEQDLGPVALDVDSEPHLVLFGDGRSGKSAVLRAYAHEVMRTRSPREAQLVVVDYRRSLLGEVPDDYLLHYLTSASQAQTAIRELAAHLEARLPGPDVTASQLRERSWWSGAEVFVLVDDYDLVSTAQASPASPLLPLLPQARDVGLHLVLARRSGGASRALYEPVLQTLRDLAAPGLLLSGSPDEGPLLGSERPRSTPPGRGRLVTRERGVQVVQTAWQERRG